jgi:hypothetical protein
MGSTAFSWVVMATLVVMSATPVGASSADQEGVAFFEGRYIDLRDGWGEAQACLVIDTTRPARCFRSEEDLEAHIDNFGLAGESGELVVVEAASACSSSLRLYDGTNYTGAVLHLSTRTTWINLSSYGFSNKTSSFKVGACSTYLAELSNGGGDWYPTSASIAGKVAPSMASGWNNRVSSVYIR